MQTSSAWRESDLREQVCVQRTAAGPPHRQLSRRKSRASWCALHGVPLLRQPRANSTRWTSALSCRTSPVRRQTQIHLLAEQRSHSHRSASSSDGKTHLSDTQHPNPATADSRAERKRRHSFMATQWLSHQMPTNKQTPASQQLYQSQHAACVCRKRARLFLLRELLHQHRRKKRVEKSVRRKGLVVQHRSHHHRQQHHRLLLLLHLLLRHHYHRRKPNGGTN